MAEVARNAQHDFWRPPAVEPVALEVASHPGLVEVCDQCETEFIAGSRFCHRCGSPREAAPPRPSWKVQARGVLRHLEFHNIEKWTFRVKQQLGLSTAALIAFLIGMVCTLSAVTMGLIFTVQTTLDWQALQMWRMEWLLGALVAFVAGILLKKSAS
jgi:hypothetical protein